MAEAMAQKLGQVEEKQPEIIERRRIEDARDYLKHYSAKSGFTAAALRMGLGDGGRTLVSKFIHRKLDGDQTRIILAAEALRAQTEGPEGITQYIGFRESRCVKKVWDYADAAREGHYMCLLVAPPGFGKTEALRAYEDARDGDGKPEISYIYCRVTTHLHALVNEVAATMHLLTPGKTGEAARLHRDIVRTLRSCPRFLIFDEADLLNERCLTFIRNLHDECGIGCLIVGRPDLLKTIDQGARWSTSNSDGKDRPILDGPLAPFVNRVVSAMLPGLGDDEVIEITEDVLKCKLAEEAAPKLIFYVGPNFKALSRLIGALRKIKSKGARMIDERMIEEAWRRIQGPVSRR